MTRLSRRQWLLAASGCLVGAAAPARAQTGFPPRRIEIVVPFPAGGTADFLGRLVAQQLAADWSVPVIVNNKPGATGSLGADYVARATPDASSLLLSSYPNRKVLFTPEPPVPDAAHDLVPVALLAKPPLVLLAHPSLGIKDVPQLIALARQRRNLDYASIGAGTPSHLAMEMFKRAADVPLQHVPYKGSGQALTDLIGGTVPLMFDSVVSSLPHVRAGRLLALGLSTRERLPALPGVPTIAESGVPGFDVSTWAVMYAPPRTPPDTVEQLHAQLIKVLARKEVMDALAQQGGSVPPALTSAQTADFVRQDVAMWRKLVHEAGIQAD